MKQLESTARDLAGQAGKLAAAVAGHAELQAALEALDQAIADTGKQLAELTEQRESGLRQAAGADLRAGRIVNRCWLSSVASLTWTPR